MNSTPSPEEPPAKDTHQDEVLPHSKGAVFGLALAALGVVYGDIGTSPLYAFRLCFNQATPPTEAAILGVLSLIFWSLAGLISVKYLLLVLRADNRGEGGILALMSLVRKDLPSSSFKRNMVIIALGLFGAALLYGDGLITPAISVLSAVEGLKVASPWFAPYVVPIAVLILAGLFWVQKHGTQKVGSVFGPIMVVWFITIAALGLPHILSMPRVFYAVNPAYAVQFFIDHQFHAFVTMGTIFLCLTGGEDLYLDMGHFGRLPIRIGWFYLVLPCLLINYFGQGAYLLAHGQSSADTSNLLYHLAPSWALYPLVVLATLSTVIASQAVISGAYSLTRQAMQLGFCPRLNIIHTSANTIGQVYLPAVNGMLFVGTLTLVLGFRNSDSLAGAYGLAVSMTMLLTSVIMSVFILRHWKWNPLLAALVMIPIFMFDVTFFTSNILKLKAGGWVGLSVAVFMFIIMTTWQKGREILRQKLTEESLPLPLFIEDVIRSKPLRVPGTAVFLTGAVNIAPRTMLHNYKHNKVLHENIVLFSLINEEQPRIAEADRVHVQRLEAGFTLISARYGFSENPDLALLLTGLKVDGLDLTPNRVTFFLGRETLILAPNRTMRPWRKNLFAFLSKNAQDASKYFNIPPNRVIEVGIQVQL
ncbi:MAG: potassium transporter Kup [bacterium]